MKAPISDSSHLSSNRLQLRVTAAIAVILSPIYLAITSTASLAQTTIVNSNPDGQLWAIQGSLSNSVRRIWKNPRPDPNSIVMSRVSLSRADQGLSIPGKTVTSLQVKNSSSTSFGMTVAGEAKYWYLCNGATGNFTLAWFQGQFTTSPCKVFKVRSGKLVQAKRPTSEITAFQPIEESSKIKQLDQAPNPAVSGKTFYCSTTSPTTSAWGFHASNNSWNLFSPTDSCAQAAAECQKASGGTCQVVNVGERSVNDSNLTASLQCDRIAPGDPRFTLRGLRGEALISQLESLKSRAKASGAGDCLINVTAPDELNLIPNGGLLDSANVYEVGGKLVTIGLTGTVLITSTQVPQGVRVTAGDVYVYDPRQPSLPNSTENRYGRCPADAYRFLPLSGYRPVSLSPGDSNLYKGKQLEDPIEMPVQQEISADVSSYSTPDSSGSLKYGQRGSDGYDSPAPGLPWGVLIPGIIRILTPPAGDPSQSPEPSPRPEPSRPPRSFTPNAGGALCSLPPDPALRQQIITASPSISAFLAETNWGEPAFDSTYRTTIAQQFLNASTGISQGGR